LTNCNALSFEFDIIIPVSLIRFRALGKLFKVKKRKKDTENNPNVFAVLVQVSVKCKEKLKPY